jgi:hypothetical protein
VTVCSNCAHAWQDGGGVALPIDATAKGVAECNAQRIGSLDADQPARATQDVPPATVRLVKRRDHNRCRVPGCRSSVGLDVHHLVPRADGGGHEPSNLVTTCGSCHRAIHAGTLVLRGTAAAGFVVERPGDPDLPSSHVGARIDRDAQLALVTLGFSSKVARDAVAIARRKLEPYSTIDAMIAAALSATRA